MLEKNHLLKMVTAGADGDEAFMLESNIPVASYAPVGASMHARRQGGRERAVAIRGGGGVLLVCVKVKSMGPVEAAQQKRAVRQILS